MTAPGAVLGVSFGSPWLLAALAVVPLAVWWYLADQRRRQAQEAAFAAPAVAPSVLRDRPGWRRHAPIALYGLALALLGLALAYAGRTAEAIREGERGVSLLPREKDAFTAPYLEHQLARIYILAGEHDRAVDLLERLLAHPYLLSPGWLRVDPTFDPLRKHPRFVKLLS